MTNSFYQKKQSPFANQSNKESSTTSQSQRSGYQGSSQSDRSQRSGYQGSSQSDRSQRSGYQTKIKPAQGQANVYTEDQNQASLDAHASKAYQPELSYQSYRAPLKEELIQSQKEMEETVLEDGVASMEHDQIFNQSTVLCGVQSLMTLLTKAPERIIKILYHGILQGNRQQVIEKAQALTIPCEAVRLKQIEHFLPELQHQGLLAFVKPADLVDWESLCLPYTESQHPTLLVALDQVTDPRNFGAILRSAEALGFQGALITRNRCAKPGPVVARTSAGASEILPIAMETNLAQALSFAKSKGFQIVGADMGGKNLTQIDWKQPTVVVIGAEGYGMREKTIQTCDQIVSIPHYGLTESLNASVAASILFYEANRWRCI